ncbi:MAG: glycoside hydrolase family 9 protein, partial [Planctomycetota bacterium]
GRCAAALALAGRNDAAESLYRLARARPGCVHSVPVRAPYYYAERDYLDDLEWAATELYIATRQPEYLEQALTYARQAGESPIIGQSDPAQPDRPARHAHYAFFPYVNLAHWRLYGHAGADAQRELAGFYRAALERVLRLADKNPYRLGTPLVWCSTNDVLAVATQAVLYERMTGDRRFRPLATECRDWIFGRNPWGVSFVIGVPAEHSASRPHHLFHKLKDHLPVGGLVDGPVYKDINDALKYQAFEADRLARFQSAAGVYHDFFADFATNEPIIDGTASLLLLLHVWPSAARPGG